MFSYILSVDIHTIIFMPQLKAWRLLPIIVFRTAKVLITDKHITGSWIKQETMLLCLKKNWQAMLRLEQVIIRAIVW